MTLRIVVADDHAAYRRCLTEVLAQQPGLSVVASAADGRGALEALERLRRRLPDVLILDLEMRDLSGLQLARYLGMAHPGLHMLMLSWYDDLPLIHAAQAAGCLGYLLKDDPLDELLHAVREVAEGRRHLSLAVRNAQISRHRISAFC